MLHLIDNLYNPLAAVKRLINNCPPGEIEQFGFDHNTARELCQALMHFAELPEAEDNSSKLKELLVEKSLSQNPRATNRLVRLLHDGERFDQAASRNSSVINSAKITVSGQDYRISSASFMGSGKKFSPNSDHSTGVRYKEKSKLVTAIADGVSGTHTDREYNTGKMAAKLAIRILEENQDELSKVSDQELPKKIKSLEQKISTEIASRFQYALDTGYISRSKDLCGPQTTFAAVLDAGDKFILVAMGDPLIFAFDTNGIVLNSLNDLHQTKSGEITSALGGQYVESSLARLIARGLGRVSKAPKLETQCSKGDVVVKASPSISIKAIDKKNISGMVLCTDGIIDRNTLMNFNSQGLWKKIFALENTQDIVGCFLNIAKEMGGTDDKTITVIKNI